MEKRAIQEKILRKLMSMNSAQKAQIVQDYQKATGDTGSTEVQVALMTARINDLTGHFKTHAKDHHSRRGLLKLVGQRRRLLDYVKSKDSERYAALAARLMVEQYGPPQWASAGQLEWASAAPWKRIVVRGRGRGFLEQAVCYRVPQDRMDALQDFGRGLRPDLERGELSATGESEEGNLLCLNLANEVALGKLDAQGAGRLYDQTLRKSYAGKSSPYLERLLFGVSLPQDGVLPLP